MFNYKNRKHEIILVSKHTKKKRKKERREKGMGESFFYYVGYYVRNT